MKNQLDLWDRRDRTDVCCRRLKQPISNCHKIHIKLCSHMIFELFYYLHVLCRLWEFSRENNPKKVCIDWILCDKAIGCWVLLERSIMVNMWHLAGWLLWLQVHSFKPSSPRQCAQRCSPQLRQFHHQLTFLLSPIILNWEAFKTSLILIMPCCNMTVTVVWDSGSQISKIDES